MADDPSSNTDQTAPDAEPRVPDRQPGPERPGLGAAIARGLRIVFTPVLWVVRPLVFSISKEPGNPKVQFTSFSTLMYLWPIMVVGWIGCVLLNLGWAGPAVLGWAWITVMLLVMLCVGADMDRNKFIIILLLIVLGWLGGVLLKEKADIPILSYIYEFFAALNVQFDPGTARVFSIAILILLVGVLFVAWFDGRYEVTTREITHIRLLRTSDSLPRAAKRVKRDWRDLSEVLFGLGAGDLIVIDSNKNVVMRIRNIPFLWFFRHDIDHILEVLATTDVEDIAAADEEET